MRKLGLGPEHFPDRQAAVWPEAWPAVELYIENQTQWAQSMAGPTGLNYGVFFAEMDRQGIQGKEREAMMDHLRFIEREILNRIYEDKGE
ncbi:DUF1799 domain-containing protein [Candidimonas humi]|uniref:DUF1799 domain-containing protein n=1 Tax=Candidimonas humi TaxID=683355 RepID=A0ABV8NUI1_9BURK|nr:DUF1799 domain-containing protein [Candidimonas humi]MBV6304939.1 DUF1799 domain-containing protein [Candidimonas humi]